MGKRGPRPKPNRLKQLQGSWRGNINKREPKPDPAPAEAPLAKPAAPTEKPPEKPAAPPSPPEDNEASSDPYRRLH